MAAMDRSQWGKWLNDNIKDVDAAPSAERKQKLDALFEGIIKRYAGQGLGALKADLDARDPELENLFPAPVYRRRAVKTLEEVKSTESKSSVASAVTQRFPFSESRTSSQTTQFYDSFRSGSSQASGAGVWELNSQASHSSVKKVTTQPHLPEENELLEMNSIAAPLQAFFDSDFLQHLKADHAALTGIELPEAQVQLDLRSLNEQHWEVFKSNGYLEVFQALTYFFLLLSRSPTQLVQQELFWFSLPVSRKAFLKRLSEKSLTSKLTAEVALAYSIIELLEPSLPGETHPFVFSESFEVLTVRRSVAIPVGDLYSVHFLNALKKLKVEPGKDHDLSLPLVVLLDLYKYRQLQDLKLNFDIDLSEAPKGLRVRVVLLGDWVHCHRCQFSYDKGPVAHFTVNPSKVKKSSIGAVLSSASNKQGTVHIRLINSNPSSDGSSSLKATGEEVVGLLNAQSAALVCGSGVSQMVCSKAIDWNRMANPNFSAQSKTTKLPIMFGHIKSNWSSTSENLRFSTKTQQQRLRNLIPDRASPKIVGLFKRVNRIFTTNYDEVIEMICDRETISIKNKNRHSTFDEHPEHFVLHLSGIMSERHILNNFTLSREEYHDPVLLTNFLRFMVQQMTERSLVFVGVRGLLVDPHWVLLWETLAGAAKKTFMPMFVAYRNATEQSEISTRFNFVSKLIDGKSKCSLCDLETILSSISTVIESKEKDSFFEKNRKALVDSLPSMSKYQDICELGHGGFGVVRLVILDGKFAALKKLTSNEKTTSDQIHEYLEREIFAIQQCKHENIIEAIGLCSHDPSAKSLILELADYGSLHKSLEEMDIFNNINHLSLKFRWLRDLANAVKYMHRQGVLHKDINVNNVLLFRGLKVKLTDLGASRTIDENHTLCVGTFWEPEYANQYPSHPKMDVYAFGCLILQVMLGPQFSVFQHDKRSLEYIISETKNTLHNQHPRTAESVTVLLEDCFLPRSARIDSTELHDRLNTIYEQFEQGLGQQPIEKELAEARLELAIRHKIETPLFNSLWERLVPAELRQNSLSPGLKARMLQVVQRSGLPQLASGQAPEQDLQKLIHQELCAELFGSCPPRLGLDSLPKLGLLEIARSNIIQDFKAQLPNLNFFADQQPLQPFLAAFIQEAGWLAPTLQQLALDRLQQVLVQRAVERRGIDALINPHIWAFDALLVGSLTSPLGQARLGLWRGQACLLLPMPQQLPPKQLQVLLSTHHPHALRCLGLLPSGGALAFEAPRYCSLQALLLQRQQQGQRPLPERLRLRWLRDLAAALRGFRVNDMVHGAVSPNNVFLISGLEVRLGPARLGNADGADSDGPAFLELIRELLSTGVPTATATLTRAALEASLTQNIPDFWAAEVLLNRTMQRQLQQQQQQQDQSEQGDGEAEIEEQLERDLSLSGLAGQWNQGNATVTRWVASFPGLDAIRSLDGLQQNGYSEISSVWKNVVAGRFDWGLLVAETEPNQPEIPTETTAPIQQLGPLLFQMTGAAAFEQGPADPATLAAAALGAGAVPLLVTLSRTGSTVVREESQRVLDILAADPNNICALAELLQDRHAYEVREFSVRMLASLALSSPANLLSIAQAGAVPALVEFSRVGNEETQNLCRLALLLLSMTPVAVACLLPLLDDHNGAEVREFAAQALGGLVENAAHRAAVIEAGAVPSLLLGLRDRSAIVQERCSAALAAVSGTVQGQDLAAMSLEVPLLVSLLRDQSAMVQQNASQVLVTLVLKDKASQIAAVNACAVSLVINLLWGQSAAVRQNAVQVLAALVREDEANQVVAVIHGAVPLVVKELQSSLTDETQSSCLRLLRSLIATDPVAQAEAVGVQGLRIVAASFDQASAHREDGLTLLNMMAEHAEAVGQLVAILGSKADVGKMSLAVRALTRFVAPGGSSAETVASCPGVAAAVANLMEAQNLPDDTLDQGVELLAFLSSKVGLLAELMQAGAAQHLVDVLRSLSLASDSANGSNEEKRSATRLRCTQAVGNLAENDDFREAIGKIHGALSFLVDLLEDPSTGVREKAVSCLEKLAANNNDNQVAIAAAGAIPVLVGLLKNPSAGVKERAAGCLWNLALSNNNNKVTIAEEGAIPVLVWLLKDPSAGVKEKAAGCLRSLAKNNDNQNAIAAAGAIPVLVELLRDPYAGVREQAAWCLSNLSENNDTNKVAIASAGGIPVLVELLKDHYAGVREQAAWCLRFLARNNDNQVAIAAAGAIPMLVDLLKDLTDGVRIEGVWCLNNLAWNNNDNRVAIAAAGAIPVLVGLMKDTSAGVKEQAARSLWNLAENDCNKMMIAEVGAISPLVWLLNDPSAGVREQAAGCLWKMAENIDNKNAILGLIDRSLFSKNKNNNYYFRNLKESLGL